jgi:hypothetical protein
VVTKPGQLWPQTNKVTGYQGTAIREFADFPCYSPASDSPQKRAFQKVRL